VLVANEDYHNSFVGAYHLGDIQFRDHHSQESSNILYWKETKNFADGCAPHIIGSTFADGNMDMPGGHGAFVMEDVTLKGRAVMMANHHCGVGVTGALCMSQFILVRPKIRLTGSVWLTYGHTDNDGGLFALSPEDTSDGNRAGVLFPSGYQRCTEVKPISSALTEVRRACGRLTLERTSKHAIATAFFARGLCAAFTSGLRVMVIRVSRSRSRKTDGVWHRGG
jgi:hypothetical protein